MVKVEEQFVLMIIEMNVSYLNLKQFFEVTRSSWRTACNYLHFESFIIYKRLMISVNDAINLNFLYGL